MNATAPPNAAWTRPPLLLTAHTLAQALEFAVNIPFDQVPENVAHWYTDMNGQVEGDVTNVETVYGYFYLTEQDAPGEIDAPNRSGLFIKVQGNQNYFVIGQHGEGMDMDGLVDEQRVYLISCEDFTRMSGRQAPAVYLLGAMNREREDPYLRMTAAMADVKAGADASASLLKSRVPQRPHAHIHAPH